jgi:Tfp pilus assembly protein PilF
MVSTYAPARLSLADLLLRQGRTKDASVELQKVLDTQPASMQARVLKFSIDATEKRFVDADKELAELQKDQPNNAFVSFKAGLYYQMRGMAPQAEKSFLRALELQPDSDEILQNLAQFYVLQKQPDRALQVIQTKVPDAKKRAFHYDLIGLIYSRGGRSQEAEASYKKALQMEPDRINTMSNLTTEYIQAKRYDDAIKQIDDLLKRTPNNASAYATRGMIYQTRNELDKARDSYDRALKIDPNNYAAANNMAYLLAEQGVDLTAAETFAKTARRLQPEQPESADTLGWVQHKLGHDVQAREQLVFAVSKQPDNPTLQYHLAMIYKGTKQVPLAQAALRKALATKGEFKERDLAEAALKELSSQK